MLVLNQNFDFDRDASQNDKEGFTQPPVRLACIPKIRFYRLITLRDAAKKHDGNQLFNSPWWFPKETFDALLRIARNLHHPIPVAARSRLAVLEDWNPTMDWLCIIELTKPAYAWRGRIRYQPADSARKVLLMGGLAQVYLPNLARDVHGLDSDHARILYFGSAADFS